MCQKLTAQPEETLNTVHQLSENGKLPSPDVKVKNESEHEEGHQLLDDVHAELVQIKANEEEVHNEHLFFIYIVQNVFCHESY